MSLKIVTVARVTSHNLYFSVCSNCPPPAETLTPLFNSTVNNRVTQSDPLADDVSFQLVDVRDLGMIDSLLKHTPHGVVNQVKVW